MHPLDARDRQPLWRDDHLAPPHNQKWLTDDGQRHHPRHQLHHYLELLDKTDAQGRSMAMLSTAKHRGKERRTVHEDLGKVHEDGLLKEL